MKCSQKPKGKNPPGFFIKKPQIFTVFYRFHPAPPEPNRI